MNDDTAPITGADLAAALGLDEAVLNRLAARLGLRRGREGMYSAAYTDRLRVAVAAGRARRERRLAAHRPKNSAATSSDRVTVRTLATNLGVSTGTIYNRARALGFALDRSGLTPDQVTAIRTFTPPPRGPAPARRVRTPAPPACPGAPARIANATLAASLGLHPETLRSRARVLGLITAGRGYSPDEAQALRVYVPDPGVSRALSPAEEEEVRQLYGTGRYTRRELETVYGVSDGPIQRALTGIILTESARRAIERRGGRRLTAPEVRAIRQRLARHDRHEVIAADFGVSVSAISNISTGRTWADLDAAPLREDAGNRSLESHS